MSILGPHYVYLLRLDQNLLESVEMNKGDMRAFIGAAGLFVIAVIGCIYIVWKG